MLRRALGLSTLLVACGGGEQPSLGEAASPARGGELVSVFVVLEGAPAVEVVAAGSDFGSPDAVMRTRGRLAQLAAQHDEVRPKLVALGAVVHGELRRVANAFHVEVPASELDAVARIHGVLRLDPVTLYERSLASALPVVRAPEVWAGTPGYHGEDVVIGILDTGIDYLHADLGGAGDPAEYAANDQTIIEPGSFPTARVVGGHDFAGADYNPSAGNSSPQPDDDPLDCGGHGSHVAGIAAGNGVLGDGTPYTGPYDQSFEPTAFRVAPGVAPMARLFALKIFGCEGSTGLVPQGLELAVDPDEDGDFGDRLDVVNASLGSAYGTGSPLDDQVIDAFTAAGGLFVVSSGNEGGIFFISGTPGTQDNSLSVAASVDVSLVSLVVSAPAGLAGSFAASEALFTPPLATSPEVTGTVVMADPPLACDGVDNGAEVAGKILLVDRGGCLFYDKFVSAEAAGAIGVIIANNDFGEPFPAAPPAPEDASPLPGVMIRLADATLMEQALPSGVVVTFTAERFAGVGAELVAGLSSRGPSIIDGSLKPEIAAPGVAIDSANVGSGIDATSKQGTSMAAPFVTGVAALVRQAHPALAPLDVKATLMNTATPLVNGEGDAYPISLQGSGRVDAVRAVAQQVSAHLVGGGGAVAVSFGAISTAEPVSVERTIELENHGDAAASFAVSVAHVNALPGVTVTVAPPEVSLAAGEKQELTVTLALDPPVLGDPPRDPVTPETQVTLPRHALDEAAGRIVFSDTSAGGQSLSLPFYAVVRAASALIAGPAQGCTADASEVVAVPLVGDSAHPSPAISAFELGTADPENTQLGFDATLDLRAVGVATDSAVSASLDEASIHFGVAVTGEWTTPAQGKRSLVGIAIDTDEDGFVDYALHAEAYNRDNDYADVLVASLYDAKTCQSYAGDGCTRVGSKRYLDLVPANEADTQPFFNGVLVLSAFARDLGLDEEDTTFDYFAYSLGLIGVQEKTQTVRFDVAHPRVDPARGAPAPGLPLYGLDQPVIAHLARDEAGFVPDLLLLHHNAPQGARFEIVPVGAYTPDSLALGHDLPASAPAGARISGQVRLTNSGSTPIYGIELLGDVLGGTAVHLAPSHGACEASPLHAIDCELGAIPPGATRSVTLQIDPAAGATSADVALTVQSESGCETPLSISVSLVPEVAPEPLDVGGGCSCRLPAAPPARAEWLLAVAALALYRLRRR